MSCLILIQGLNGTISEEELNWLTVLPLLLNPRFKNSASFGRHGATFSPLSVCQILTWIRSKSWVMIGLLRPCHWPWWLIWKTAVIFFTVFRSSLRNHSIPTFLLTLNPLFFPSWTSRQNDSLPLLLLFFILWMDRLPSNLHQSSDGRPFLIPIQEKLPLPALYW